MGAYKRSVVLRNCSGLLLALALGSQCGCIRNHAFLDAEKLRGFSDSHLSIEDNALLVKAAASPEPVLRALALERIASLQKKELRHLAVRALADNDVAVRDWAAFALVVIDPVGGVDELWSLALAANTNTVDSFRSRLICDRTQESDAESRVVAGGMIATLVLQSCGKHRSLFARLDEMRESERRRTTEQRESELRRSEVDVVESLRPSKDLEELRSTELVHNSPEKGKVAVLPVESDFGSPKQISCAQSEVQPSLDRVAVRVVGNALEFDYLIFAPLVNLMSVREIKFCLLEKVLDVGQPAIRDLSAASKVAVLRLKFTATFAQEDRFGNQIGQKTVVIASAAIRRSYLSRIDSKRMFGRWIVNGVDDFLVKMTPNFDSIYINNRYPR